MKSASSEPTSFTIHHDYGQRHQALLRHHGLGVKLNPMLWLAQAALQLMQKLQPARQSTTQIDTSGLTLRYGFGSQSHLSWSDVNLLDLHALRGHRLTELGKNQPSLRPLVDFANATRSFKVRVHPHKASSIRPSLGKYECWHTDVLTVLNIPLAKAPDLLKFLEDIRRQHPHISEDIIVDDFES
jgi:hypothetical protein